DYVAATHGITEAGVLDTTNPTALITSTESGTTTLTTIPITITFSEEVANFDVGDVTVGNGIASNLSTSDNIVFTTDVTPISGGFVTVDILSGVATDLTGNGNDVSTQFSIDYIAPENVLDFDGTDDYVDLGSFSSLDNLNELTIEAWINVDNFTDYDGIVSSFSSISSTVDLLLGGAGDATSQGIYFRVANGSNAYAYTTSAPLIADTWHHIVGVFNGNGATNADRFKIYIDGVEQSLVFSGTAPATTPSVAANMNVGYYTSGGHYLNGSIDEVRIWNVARSKTQILGNLTNSIKTASGLVASYDFNKETGTDLFDLSGNGNDGVLTNFDFSGTSSDWIASTVPTCAPNGKFIGTANSDWNNPSNWCGGVVPDNSDVTENVVVSIDSDIIETEDLVLNANDFQVSSGANLDLNLGLNNLEITNNATFTNDGTVNVTNGTNINATSGTFTNNGTVNVQNGTGVNGTSGSFVNNGTFFFENGSQLASPTGTFINNGTLKGFFTVNNNFTNPAIGTVAPGASPGCASFVSDFTNDGTLDVEIDGTIECTQYDQITVGGTANLSGTLNVTLGYTPVSGSQFVIIDATTISGTFSVENLPDANWSVNYSATQVVLSYINPAEAIGSTGPGG
ncbi:MAG: LamG-like jellyroll fold domain-containing protein, partial [Marinoscillum sp.]